jgi:hypothetical protein
VTHWTSYFFKLFICLFVCLFWDGVSLCSLGLPRTCDLPTSASRVLGLQVFTTMSSDNCTLCSLCPFSHLSEDSIENSNIYSRPLFTGTPQRKTFVAILSTLRLVWISAIVSGWWDCGEKVLCICQTP